MAHKSLWILCAALFVTSTALATIPSEWVGRYQGMSRACGNDWVTIAPETLFYNKCEHTIVEKLVSTETELTIRVKDKNVCGWQDSIISLKRPYGAAVDFYNYKTLEDFKNNHYRAFCGFGPKR